VKRVALLLLVSAAACQTPAPASPWLDGGFTTSCQQACTVVAGFSCPEGAAGDCASSFSSWDQGPAHIRRPDTGAALTCVDVAAATSVAQLRAMGVGCVQADR
jgi:hypothetical protein